jgi:GNAT superfamily N-acetyltransferase
MPPVPDTPPPGIVEGLCDRHDRAVFSCGNLFLDRYLKEQAGQDLRRRCASPFVLVPASESPTILGYYTLSSYGVDVGELPVGVARRLPRYPLLPATLLGRLAVDQRHHGHGIGEFLLLDALHRACEHAVDIAAAAVIVDAIDPAAARFYQRFGFMPFPSRNTRLFLPMKTVAALFD